MASENPIHVVELEKDWWDKAKPYVEIAGVLVVAAYTVIAGLQWRAIRRANALTQQTLNATQSQFRKQRRPYVGITEIKPQTLTTDGTLTATARNYGATPARAVYAYGVFQNEITKRWRYETCGGVEKSMDWEMAGPAIFQNSDPEPIKISISPATQPRKYLAVCITFMDTQGAFPYKFQDGITRLSPYAIKHLFDVESENGKLTFAKIYTSVEGEPD